MTDIASNESPPFTAFSDWLTDHAQGDVDVEMTLALAEVVQAVANHGKKGTVTLKVSINTAGSGGRTVETACEVEAKAPTADPERSIFYVGDKGSLHRDDPYQRRLPLRRITEPQLPHTTED
jgi:hypothetical protein